MRTNTFIGMVAQALLASGLATFHLATVAIFPALMLFILGFDAVVEAIKAGRRDA